MELIKELYETIRAEKPRTPAIREMECKIHDMVGEMKLESENEREKTTDLLFEASLHGEIAGFKLGCFAIFQLMKESLSCLALHEEELDSTIFHL